MAVATEIAVEADWPVGVADDEIRVAVAIEIGGRGTEADAAVLQSPLGTDRFEL